MGAAGGIYPMINPALQQKNLIGIGDSHKTTTDCPTDPSTAGNHAVGDLSETIPQLCSIGQDDSNNTDSQGMGHLELK